jgi:hypothetical protein
MPRTRAAYASVVIVLLAIAAIPAAIAASPSAAIRFVQATPDGRTVDVYLDGKRLADPKKFGEVTGFLAVESGKRKVQIVPSGGDLSTAYSIDMQIEPNNLYTVAAIGRAPELKLTAIVEPPYTLPAGKAALHIYHFSPDAPAIDLWRRAGGARDDTPLVSNLAFGTSSGYRELDVGAYELQVLPATVDVPSMGLQSLDAQADTVYSIFVINALSKKSEIIISAPTIDTPLPLKPAVLPNTSSQVAAETALGVLAMLLLICGLMLRHRARA